MYYFIYSNSWTVATVFSDMTLAHSNSFIYGVSKRTLEATIPKANSWYKIQAFSMLDYWVEIVTYATNWEKHYYS